MTTKYKYVYNWILGKYIVMSEKTYQRYTEIHDKDNEIIPYQSLDMKKNGDARFIDKKDVMEYLKMRKQYLELKMNSVCPYDLPSDIDIFKMYRDKNKYKYLIQIDPDIRVHQNDISFYINNDCNAENKESIEYVFIPYITGYRINKNDIPPEQHNLYKKIKIIANEKFTAFLKTIIPNNMIGKIIYKINDFFGAYNDMLENLSLYNDEPYMEKSTKQGKNVTSNNLIDVVLGIQRDRIYGLDVKKIADRLWIHNNLLEKYGKKKIIDCDLDKIYQNYYNYLASKNKIEQNLEAVENIRNCQAGHMFLDLLIDKKIKLLGKPNNDNYMEYLKMCPNMIFSPYDNLENSLFYKTCYQYVNNIKTDIIKNNLLNYIASTSNQQHSGIDININIDPISCIYVKEINEIPLVELNEKYMPEWYNFIYDNNIKEAYQHRQLLLGDTKITTYFRTCSILFKSDPFISKTCDIPGIIHDIEWNKVVVSCLVNKDDIFPIRIANANMVEDSRLYEYFDKTENDKLIGSLVFKLRGERTEYKERYYVLYVYLNQTIRFIIRPVDFRSNVIIPGTILEHIRVLYLEMNTLMYYELDHGIKLYFYKYEYTNTKTKDSPGISPSVFDIYVSKYSKKEILEKYKKLKNLKNEADDIVSKLKEVNIIKDVNKRIKFVVIPNVEINKNHYVEMNKNQHGGSIQESDHSVLFEKGIASQNSHTHKKYISMPNIREGIFYNIYNRRLQKDSSPSQQFKFMCTEWLWDIRYTSESNIINKEIYPMSTHLILYKSIKFFNKEMGEQIYNRKCIPLNYFSIHNIRPFPNLPKNIYKELNLEKNIGKDKTDKIYAEIMKFIDSHEGHILSYVFESSVSCNVYICLDKYKILSENSKILIFSKNHFILDSVVYYYKYRLFKRSNIYDNVFIYLYGYNFNIYEKTINYINVNHIKHEIIKNPLTNEQLDKLRNNKIDIGIIDLLISIDQLVFLRNGYAFQTYLSAIIYCLQNLNMGGTLLINTSAITNKLVMNFMIYLSCHFDEMFIYDPEDIEIQTAEAIVFSLVICKGYNKKVDIEQLLKINKENYLYDETGGFNYEITDPVEKKELSNNYYSPNPPKKYLHSIIKVNSQLDEVKNMYQFYKKYIKRKLFIILTNYNMRYLLFLNKHNEQYIKNICNTSKNQAIYLAKKYNLPLPDWIEKTPDEYFRYIFDIRLKNISYTQIKKINHNKKIPIIISTSINTQCSYRLKKEYQLSELTYQYIDKINHDEYIKIELFFNKEYKKINKLLLNKYNININGNYVSRAWIKMYELLFDIKFLDNFLSQKTVKAFHICEAPGNFINAFIYFIKKNTNIENYEWVAQSLSPNLAGFYDTYGFIKKTINHWDPGYDGSGDITKYDNLLYYYNKYHDADILVADCGEKFNENETEYSISSDIYLFQLIYALLIPRIGGNFIVKTFATNYNLTYLSLLYTLTSIYEKIFVFKSNTNFWSPEIYIVGINKNNFTDENRKLLFDFSKKISENKIVYPINQIPDSFCEEYEHIMYNFILQYTDIKKLFVFLATNIQIYKSNLNLMKQVIDERNRKWLNKYIDKSIN